MRRKRHKWVKNFEQRGGRRETVCAACGVRACRRQEGRKGTYVARSELRAIWRKREGTHEATVRVQQASLLERLAIPVVEPNLLILYTRRETQQRKRIDGVG